STAKRNPKESDASCRRIGFSKASILRGNFTLVSRSGRRAMALRFVIGFIFLAAAVLPAHAQEKPKIYFGASSKTLGYGPLWAAVKKGFLDQQGIDGQLVLLRGTPMNVQALAANSLQVGSGGAEAFYEATERGLDLVMIGGIINGLTHDIVAGKKYKNIE